MVAYAQKLAIRADGKDPATGWKSLRTLADALMLRRFDPELLEEMKGIADGAAEAGAKLYDRKFDLVDVVTLNSAIDLDQMQSALPVTPSAITGKTFSPEDELAVPDRLHKCSSLSATGPATASGKPVFFQIFMWDGYTGAHFNVILDVVPEKGRRFVMQTFPGGIHSGTDFYMNDAGLVIGETTVLQTPFEAEGEPQSSRIRRAIQYGTSIDEAAAILRAKNNGMYTNDWTMADVKTGESAILLLGTKQSKLWRSTDSPAPFGTPGFLWANNNARDPLVRREVAAQPEDAPFDSTFTPANRDVAFQQFYARQKGQIDVESAIELMASSPINRPHACDGKVTDAEMASQLVFMAHQGKTTQREKFPAPGSRRMPDLPGAIPHLTYGYATFSPVVIAEGLKAARAAQAKPAPKVERTEETKALADRYDFKREDLWAGSIFPATDADNWLIAGSAAYWRLLRDLPEKPAERPDALARALAGVRSRLLTVIAREGDLAAIKGGVAFDRYAPAQVPRLKGIFALHQLRLRVGSKPFFAFMKSFHATHRNQEVTTAQFFDAARTAFKRDVAGDLQPWLERTGLPAPAPSVAVAAQGKQWRVTVNTTQGAEPYRLAATVAVLTTKTRHFFPLVLDGPKSTATFTVPEKPTSVVFDALSDLPIATDRRHAFSAFTDDFSNTVIAYGTGRQLEANHTLALRFQSVLADAFSETLPPVVQDAAMDDATLAAHDLFVLGDPRDNALLARLLPNLPLETGPGYFRFEGQTYADEHDGLYLALPNPFAPTRVLHILLSNTPLQLHEMTKTYRPGLPAWAIFKGEKVEKEGHFPIEAFSLTVK
ncbi:MAG: C45 family autoproteolytic acyltransferase/hydrolase [Vicinamibacteria bacterium]|nr:C45 family autoproteolytic acyltransferase/hydrolase [Vicinamibacteria bacterium]